MRPVRIVDVATANPPLRVTQREILESIERSADRSAREKKLYRALLSEPSIETRYVAIDAGDSLESLFGESADHAAARFERQATRLGAAAVERLLQASGLAGRVTLLAGRARPQRRDGPAGALHSRALGAAPWRRRPPRA